MKNFEIQNIALAQKLFGTHNVNLEKIARAFDVKINSRGGGNFSQWSGKKNR